MFFFFPFIFSQCTREGMYKIPIMVYLDIDSIDAIALESNMDAAIDKHTQASNFLGEIFNEINDILLRYKIQVHMSLQPPINLNVFLNCGHQSPINTFMKSIESKKKFKTAFNKLFIVFCDNFVSYLDMDKGIYNGYKNCTTNSGIIYVNNVILKAKIQNVILGMIARTIVKTIDINFEKKACQYVAECIDGKIDAVGEYTSWLRYVNNVEYNDPSGQDTLEFE